MTNHLPIIAIQVLFLGAFISGLVGYKSNSLRKFVIFLATGTSLVLTLMLFKPVMMDGQIISYWMGNWAPVSDWAIGIGLEVDQLSLFFGLIVTVTVFLGAIYSFKYMSKDNGQDKYYVVFMMLAGSVLGFVFTGDLFNMYVMIEIMTFAAVGLTAFRNHKAESIEAAFKYLVVGSIGSSLILLGTVVMYAQFKTLNLAQITAMLNNAQHTPVILFAFALMIGGYAVKAFIVPCHVVAPDAYAAAPSSVSMLFSGIVNKAGIYGMVRLVFVVFASMNLPSMQFLLVFLGTITMFIGVTMALAQSDFKRLLAFHSISQIGYVLTAIGLSTILGLTGGLYHALNHTLFKGLLFLCAGAVLYSTGTTDLNKLGGLAKKMPQTAALFLVGAFAISGIPPFNGFVSKWLVYQGTFAKSMETNNPGYVFVTIVALIVSVMTLASFIKVTQSVFFGQLPKEFENAEEVPLSMRIPMWILAALCLVAGILPTAVIDYLIKPAVLAIKSAGNYVAVMMGQEYATKIYTEGIAIPKYDYAMAGWNPTSWLILFGVLLIAFALVALTGGFNPRHIVGAEDNNAKFDVFFSGEAAEHSHVAGNDLFWGLKHNLKGYFHFMHDVHNGVVNDYALMVVSTTALVMLYLFLLVK